MKSTRHLLAAFGALVLAGVLAGCASIGAPVPPSLGLPKPPTDLRATRKGNRVYLSWIVSTQTTDRQKVRRPGPTHICRSILPVMSQCDTSVGNLPPPAGVSSSGGSESKTEVQPKPRAQFVDTIPVDLQQQNPTGMATYAVETMNKEARSAGLSNRVQVPLAPTLLPPDNFRARMTKNGVVLNWDCKQFPQQPPGLRYLYRIRRRSLDSGVDVILADLDCPGPFEDRTIEWQKSYRYRIAVVTLVTSRSSEECASSIPRYLGTSACADVPSVEGDDSPFQEISANDVYPPDVPTGLQAVFSGAGQLPFIDLLWAPNTDSDLAGYNVYRRVAGGQPIKLNADLVKAPSFRDTTVARGTTYSYSVSAVDSRGNESSNSKEALETVPQD